MPTVSTTSGGVKLFPEVLIPELMQLTTGKSALAQLCGATPIPFNGRKEFTFSLDKEIDIVAENGPKSNGGFTITPKVITPIKVEYGARVSDEFDYATDEVKVDYLRAFSDGFAKKLARGLDLMAFHGVNPRTGSASAVIGANCFDKAITQIAYSKTTAGAAAGTADELMEAAIALVQGNDLDVTGAAFSPAFRSALAKLTTPQGAKLYPELAWGNAPGTVNGLPVQVNSTVSANSSNDMVVAGNFADGFRWGFAKEIPLEIIRYGNPDNDAEAGDLKGHNQIYIRAEAFLGWAILLPNAFALVKDANTPSN